MFVSEGNQLILLSGCAVLYPGALLGVASAPLLRVPHGPVPSPASNPVTRDGPAYVVSCPALDTRENITYVFTPSARRCAEVGLHNPRPNA